MSRTVDGVLVAGAGPVGITTALVLARCGIPVTIIDPERDVVRSPRALVYHPATLEALGALGLMEDLAAAGVLKQELELRDGAHRVLGHISYAALEGRTRYPYNLHLGQDVLAEIVLSHFLRLPDTAVRWGTRLTGVEQDADGVTVTATSEDGRSETVRTAWLVGADGARSGTRRALGLDFEGVTWPERFVATNVYHDFEAHGFGKAVFVHDPEHWAIIVKINEAGLWRVTYGESADLPEAGVRDRVAEKYRHVMPGYEAWRLDVVSPYRVHQRCAPTFRVGRVLLVGDAAHITNPCGGLGLTSGLLDAVACGYALAAVIRGSRDKAVLDDYARERRRIFLEVTSPIASENRRRLQEADPVRRQADGERLRRLREEPDFAREAASVSFRLASPRFGAGLLD